jgi:hypothetical protein
VPEIERQQAQGKRVAFRPDAAFARPAIYEALEARGVQYAIRIPANKNLELAIEDVLFRSPGRPSRTPLNVTVVNETYGYAVFVAPVPTASASTSTLNFNTGDIASNGLTVALGSGGTLSATYMSSAGNTTDLIFDVTGYFVP